MEMALYAGKLGRTYTFKPLPEVWEEDNEQTSEVEHQEVEEGQGNGSSTLADDPVYADRFRDEGRDDHATSRESKAARWWRKHRGMERG